MENEMKEHVIHTALDTLHIPAGPVITRLASLINTMKVLRTSLSDSIQCRINAIEKLTRLARQLSLPAREQTPVGVAVKVYNAQIQREVETIISDLAAMTPDYLQAEVVVNVVKAAQEVMDHAEDMLATMHAHFPTGDPLRKSLRDSLAQLHLELTAIRARRGETATREAEGKTLTQSCVLEEIRQERVRQDAKWGAQDHQPMVWLSILGEEYGELAQAINETVFDNGPVERLKGGYMNIRREAIQVAAVAVVLVENLDRLSVGGRIR